MKMPDKINKWNDTFRDYPLHKTLVQFIEEQVESSPQTVAIYFGDLEVTFYELNQRANKLASYLRKQGVGVDSLVGVFMERSVEMVVALVGIAKAGGAYVPLDPEYPEERIQYMFENSQVKIVLTQSQLDHSIIPEAVEAISLNDDYWRIVSQDDSINLPIITEPESACYMIYTSGSTGKPKGVINDNKALINRILWMQEAFEIGVGDMVLQKTPYSFDVSVWEFFWPLMTGASIVMAKPGGHKDADYLVETIEKFGVTIMHFVPSMLSLFLTAKNLHKTTCLKKVMCSGEALPYELTRRFFELVPGVELHNLYGPTEAAIDVTHWACRPDSDISIVPIGKPIANIQTYILDEDLSPVAIGEEGELHLAGVGLARGYWNRPTLTSEKFIPNPFGEAGSRMYKTGDLARYMEDGNIEYLGRIDNQIKLRGFRIELGEIEALLLQQKNIDEVCVIATDAQLEERQLLAYLVSKAQERPSASFLRGELLKHLPEFMVPAHFIFIDEMPLSPNGKIDRRSLAKIGFDRPELSEMYIAPRSELEKQLTELWTSMLKLNKVGVKDNFFDIGGNSLLAVRMAMEIEKKIGHQVPLVKIFEFGTIEKLAAYIEGKDKQTAADIYNERATRMRIGRFSGVDEDMDGVAVIGMVGRFPGAGSIEELWDNLINGVESISTFGPDELDPWIEEDIRNDQNYVPSRGILDNADLFDNKFFGIGPMEAKVMDPQQRVFLELAWAALEKVGYTADDFKGMIGVYAGVGDNHYYARNVLGHREICRTVGDLIVGYGNEKDYIATRVSFALNLTGPSISVNTGCSTSLLAIDMAFKALVDYECDMALAGGVDIHAPQKTGQMYQEGGTFTKDGHCKPFDADATGTMFSDGAGIVVLKRLKDAVADGDQIFAVVKGIAKNNDGSNKVSFLAPSVEGQAQVIALAHAQANVTADTISYVEAHGTGTPLGDPIEIEGLTKAFAITTDKTQFCHIGSIKGNVGHPTIASGVAGFIKASLSLYHEVIPPTLHFTKPNPRIDFSSTPFKVVSEVTPWLKTDIPRRAGVSSFGFGGTNVHGVLEEAPELQGPDPSPNKQILVLSAKSEAALGRMLDNFENFLVTNPDVNLADAAYTLQVGRKHFEFRKSLVCKSVNDALEAIQEKKGINVNRLETIHPHVTFMFPGQGSQYINMGKDLYDSSILFKDWIDRCCDILLPVMDRDLRELLFPQPGKEDDATKSLKDTYYTQPALFTIQYALSQLWMSIGVKPGAFIGHSVGEFVGACLAGVFTLEDALKIVALRARLVRSMPKGTMLSVRCSAEEIVPHLNEQIQLAAENSPNLCVVAGPDDAIELLAGELEKAGLVTRPLHTSHAFHSAMMAPVVPDFTAAISELELSPPSIPIMSSCTGNWLTDEEATSPEYWGKHLRNPVLFAKAYASVNKEVGGVFLEVGPRDVLATLAKQQTSGKKRASIIASLANSGKDEKEDEWNDMLAAVGGLWEQGVSIDWRFHFIGEKRRRIPLPTYPFEPTSFWLPTIGYQSAATVTVGFQADSIPETVYDSGDEASNTNIDDPAIAAIKQIMVETVGIELGPGEETTPFMMLGADSLGLMQMSRLVEERLGLSVNFRQLLDSFPTPKILADALRELGVEEAVKKDKGNGTGKEAIKPEEGKIELDPERLKDSFLGLDENNELAWFVNGQGGQILKLELN